MWWWHSRLVDDPTTSADALGCNRRRNGVQRPARGGTLSEVAFEGQRTRLFGRRAGVRASGHVYGTVGLYISRHIYDLMTCADILKANRCRAAPRRSRSAHSTELESPRIGVSNVV